MLRQAILPCKVLVVLWDVRDPVNELVYDVNSEDEVVYDERQAEENNGDESQRRYRRVAP